MKTATLLRVGPGNIAARWFGLLAVAGLLLGAASLQAQSSKTETTVTTLGGGPQYYNPGGSFGSSNSVYGTLYSQFHTPSGLAYDSSVDYLYVADRDNNAIRLIDLSDPANPSETYTFAPYPPYIPTNLISQPVGVAVDALSHVFVLNRGKGNNGTVLEFDYFGDLIATNMTGLTNASGIALDTRGDIYVTTSNTVFKITPAGVSNVVVTITNTGTFLQGIVVKRSGANAGWLAVCDSGRNGIYLINPASGIVKTNAGFNGAGDGTGNRNLGVFNASAKFFQPSGVAEAGDGSLIVADFGNDRVKVVTASGITTNLYGVSSNLWWNNVSSAYFGWSDGTVLEPDGGIGNVQARMPFGVTIGPDSTVYTTEDYYHIIRKVTAANIQVPPPWPPPPPTGLAVSPVPLNNYGEVILTWTASSGATNYNVKRSTSSGAETTIASIPSTTGQTSYSYTDTNVLDGTTYYYVVSALNSGGEGQNSTEVSATPLFSPAPTNLIVVTTNFGLVSLAWAPSAGATSYNVNRSPSHLGPYATIASTTSTTYNDNTVVNGTTYYYVVTAVNAGGENLTNSTEVKVTVPIPPPPPPAIGWFDYEGTAPPVTVFYPVSGTAYITHNDLSLAIEPIATTGVGTFYTDDGSDPSTSNGATPPPFVNNSASSFQSLQVTTAPDLTIKAVNVNSGGSSAVVTAEFLFQVANPMIVGNNAAQFTVSDITTNAQLWYTTDGSDPTNVAPSLYAGTIITSAKGITLSLPFPDDTNVMTFKVRGFRDGYSPSGNALQVFSSTNFVANTISFGFAPSDPVGQGEASSDFVASPGQTFFAPVTLLPLSGVTIYSMQFNLTVTNAGPNPGPAITPGAFVFTSMLRKPDPANPGYYLQIPPYMFINTNSTQITNTVFYGGSTNFVNLLVTNLSENLLGVGWLERATKTNLYDTTAQDLIKYSQAHDTLFLEGGGRVILGGYSFQVPVGATNGQTYQIQIGRPSATDDGVGAPGSSVFISTPTNGSMAVGAINSIKNVTMGQLKYIVGDAYPFRWFNAGDFGDTNLENADIQQVFNSAIYNLNSPVWQAPGSDFLDAMDSCGAFGVTNPGTGYFTKAGPLTVAQQNALFNSDFTTMDQIAFGDGTLDVCDVYVTYVRSIDPQRTWYRRFWTNGVLVAEITPNVFIAGAVKQSSGGKVLPAVNPNPNPISITNTPLVNFTAGDNLQATAGQQISIPITATVFGQYLRVLMLNLSVVPLDGSPALTKPVSFTLNPPFNKFDVNDYNDPAALGVQNSSGNGNYSVALLPVQAPIPQTLGVTGNAVIGTLTINISTNATSSSSYAIHFDNASGSPNGLASFPKQTLTGLITLSSRTNSTYGDGIPDSWRLRWFGTINNYLSVSNACPSGDGINNWMKYVAGVDPNTPNDFPSLNSTTTPAPGANMGIYWPTVSGKQYAILSSASLFPGNWTTNAIVTGTGANMEYDDNAAGAAKFYRVLILP